MAHGLNPGTKRAAIGCGGNAKSETKGQQGSRRIFAPHFKLQVLDSYRNDADCKGNQRATARKYGIHRRQIQKWLQAEHNLRNSVRQPKAEGGEAPPPPAPSVDGAPLDCSTRPRSPDPAAPIDLSFKRPTPPAASLPLPAPPAPICILPPPTSTSPIRPQPDVWDLSTRGKRRRRDACPPKPFKLFKPYLDEDDDDEEKYEEMECVGTPPCCIAADNNNDYASCEPIKAEYGYAPEAAWHGFYYPLAYAPYECKSCCRATQAPPPLYETYVPTSAPTMYSLDFELSAVVDGNCCRDVGKLQTVPKWMKDEETIVLDGCVLERTQTVR